MFMEKKVHLRHVRDTKYCLAILLPSNILRKIFQRKWKIRESLALLKMKSSLLILALLGRPDLHMNAIFSCLQPSGLWFKSYLGSKPKITTRLDGFWQYLYWSWFLSYFYVGCLQYLLFEGDKVEGNFGY